LGPRLPFAVAADGPHGRVLEDGDVELRRLLGLVVEPQAWSDLLHAEILPHPRPAGNQNPSDLERAGSLRELDLGSGGEGVAARDDHALAGGHALLHLDLAAGLGAELDVLVRDGAVRPHDGDALSLAVLAREDGRDR